jgi:hypothetical protein
LNVLPRVEDQLLDRPTLKLRDNGIRVGKIKLLDKRENARTFRPQKVPTQLSFAQRRILK